MIRLKRMLVAAPLCLGLAGAANAATVNFGKEITKDGQNFSFRLPAPASNGGGGTLKMILNGNFLEPRIAAIVTFDLPSGKLVLTNSFTTRVASNNVPGLTLNWSSRTEFNVLFRSELRYKFDVSASLLNLILADNQFAGMIDLDEHVNAYDFLKHDFVGLSLSYDTPATVVPLPATLPLMTGGLLMLAIAGIGRARRRA